MRIEARYVREGDMVKLSDPHRVRSMYKLLEVESVNVVSAEPAIWLQCTAGSQSRVWRFRSDRLLAVPDISEQELTMRMLASYP